MSNVIIKSDERRAQENKMLREFGHNPKTASRETRELADAAARRSQEAIKHMEGKRR